MLPAALKAEADCFVEMFAHACLPNGRQRLVRHGAGPERVIQQPGWRRLVPGRYRANPQAR